MSDGFGGAGDAGTFLRDGRRGARFFCEMDGWVLGGMQFGVLVKVLFWGSC